MVSRIDEYPAESRVTTPRRSSGHNAANLRHPQGPALSIFTTNGVDATELWQLGSESLLTTLCAPPFPSPRTRGGVPCPTQAHELLPQPRAFRALKKPDMGRGRATRFWSLNTRSEHAPNHAGTP